MESGSFKYYYSLSSWFDISEKTKAFSTLFVRSMFKFAQETNLTGLKGLLSLMHLLLGYLAKLSK